MKKAVALGLLCGLLVACASPTVTASPTPAPTPSPSSLVVITHVAITCPVVAPDNCPPEEAAVRVALAGIDRTWASVTILPTGFLCGQPFFAGLCPVPQSRFPVAAYVTFVGTDLVAALTMAPSGGGAFVATFVVLQAPPPGWAATADTRVVTVPLGDAHAVVVTIDDQSGLLAGARPVVLPVGTVVPPSYGSRNIAAWNPAGQPASEV